MNRLASISLDREALSRFEEAVRKEWVVANGLGGYASSTTLGLNTRKYHGLLVAAFRPFGNRRVCLSKLDEEVIVGGNVYPLGSNEFQNGIFPKGHLHFKEFSLAPFPRYVYSLREAEVEKTTFVPHEKNAVIVLYRILNKSDADVEIRVFPLVNGRHFHSVTNRRNVSWDFAQKQQGEEVTVLFGAPQSALLMKSTSGGYHVDGKWVEKLYYREEAARGEQSLDDCYQTGYFSVGVKANRDEKFAIITAAEQTEDDARKVFAKMPSSTYDAEALFEREVRLREDSLTRFYALNARIPQSDWLDWLVLAADAFIVKGIREAERMVIAGYHWFEAWGRDTFISLPGLMLVNGRFEDARKVFSTFQKYCKDGLIPNFISDSADDAAYNSVDATLWFFNAVLQYAKYTGDFKFVQKSLWETMKTIIDTHVKGTAFDIRLDSDGLLSHGVRLTWMDAMVDGQAATPRAGKAVEVQALWYNALKIMELLAKRFHETTEAEAYLRMAEKARRSFADKFWSSEKGFLFDVVGDSAVDASLRPNQILAISLDFPLLGGTESERVVDVVQRELLTPFGLRTLARSDTRYAGSYAGDRSSRDRAYHNGTVWPWLLGPFVTAYLKVKGFSEFNRESAFKNFLSPLLTKQVYEAGLCFLSEVFDGDSPHNPSGCVAQAWSVAEPLRAYMEDVMQIRPRYEKEVLSGLG